MRAKSGHLRLQCCTSVLLSAILIFTAFHQPSHAQQEYFTIQVASFHTLESAQQHFETLKKKLKKSDLEHLRVEQIGQIYPVRLGKFGDRESAVSFLKRLNLQLPRAIILKVPLKEENILTLYGQQPASSPPRTEQRQAGPDTLSTDRPVVEESSPLIEQTGKTAPEQKKKKPQQPAKEKGTVAEAPETRNMSVVSGIVLESTVMPSSFPCMGSKGSLYRLLVRIEEAEDVEGYQNFLWDKRGQSMSFFTDELQPSELLARRIKATIAYKGDRACRLYWIEEIEVGQ